MDPDEDEVVITPGGPVPREQTHLVPEGYVVRVQPDGSLRVEPEAPVDDAK